MEDGRGRVELNFGNRDLLDSEFGCCLKKDFKLAKTGTYAILLVRYGGSDVLVPGKKYPKIEVIRRHFGQFSPKLPLLTVSTGPQEMFYL